MDNGEEVIATFEQLILELSQPLYPIDKPSFHYAELLIIKNCITELLDKTPKTALLYFVNEINFLRDLVNFIEDSCEETVQDGVKINLQLNRTHLIHKIENNKKITLEAHPLNALLYSDKTFVAHSQEKYLAYKSLFLISAIRIYLKKGNHGQIRSICAEGRLYIDDSRESLLKILPDASLVNLTELVQNLKKLELVYKLQMSNTNDQVKCEYARGLFNKINSYRIIFEKGCKRKPIYKRAFSHRSSHTRTRITLSEIEHVNEYINTQDIIEVSLEDKSESKLVSLEDTIQTQNRVTSIINFTDHLSNARRSIQARAIAEDKPVRAMQCSSSTNQGSTHEISIFITEAFEQFNDGEYKQEALSLFLSLLLGNDLIQIRQLKYIKEADNNAFIVREHILPTQSQQPEVQALIQLIDKVYHLALPSFISQYLNNFIFYGVDFDSQQRFISYINKRKNISLTRHKIEQHLLHVHTNQGINEFYTGLIKGANLSEFVILSYSQSSYNQLMAVYENYIDYLASLTNKVIEPIRSQVLPIDKKLGSPFYKLSKLKELFSALKEHVNAALTGDLQGEYFHNLYTLYTYYSLSLSSGYRPKSGMFGKIQDINLHSGRYRINDKNALPGNSDRIVFIPLLAKQQLHEYIKHLTHISHYAPFVETGFAERSQASLSSKSSLLFFLEKGKVQELGISYLNKKLDNIFPLQLNWHRHYAASIFLENNLHSDNIKAWMGHSNNGMVAFNKFSNQSIGKLKETSELLNTYLQYVGMEVIPYD